MELPVYFFSTKTYFIGGLYIHKLIEGLLIYCSMCYLEERQLKVDLDQEEASAKPSLEEWLCRREKRAAPSSGRYVLNP